MNWLWFIIGFLLGLLALPLLALAGIAFLALWILAPLYVPIALIALGVLLIIVGVILMVRRSGCQLKGEEGRVKEGI